MKILFFDGFCSLCNGVVDWGLRHDFKGVVQFASLQGNTAQKFLNEKQRTEIETVVYYRDGIIHERSDAVLYFLKDLGGFKASAFAFKVLPRFLRDFFYRLVAKNRYRFFPRRESCRLPSSAEKDRLLD